MMDMLSAGERDYVRGLKRKERSDLGRLLDGARGARSAVPLRIRVLQSRLTDDLKAQIFGDLAHPVGDKYLAWCAKVLRLPLGVVRPARFVDRPLATALELAGAAMDECIVGQEAAKTEVLKIVHQARVNPRGAPAAYALGLEGKPGCGKTQFVQRAMAAALGLPVVTIPLGGASDGSAFLWGHNYSYEGSKEGRLAAGLMEVGCCNPIVHFDEVDKVYDRDRGGAEIVASLIHLLDPSANHSLRDRYLHGVDIDFSRCVFVLTYNDPQKINPILLDRLNRVEFAAPTHAQRREILAQQLLPRVQRRLRTNLTVDERSVERLLESATGESGMRELERSVDHVLSSATLYRALRRGDDAVHHDTQGVVLTEREVATYMDRQRSGVGGATTAPPLGMYG